MTSLGRNGDVLSDGHKLRLIRPTSSSPLALMKPTVISHGVHFTDAATLHSRRILISQNVGCFMDWCTLTVGLLV
mgnify:CR=1 FL=1